MLGERGPPGAAGPTGGLGNRGPTGANGPVIYRFPDAAVERAAMARKPGCFVSLWYLGGDTPSLALPWVNPNKRYLYKGTKIDFPNSPAFHLPHNRLEFFAQRYKGVVYAARSGNYRFYLSSDDGSKLYINRRMIIDNDGLHGATERSGDIQLTEGDHKFRLDFYQNAGDANLRLMWEGPGFGRQFVPIFQPTKRFMRLELAKLPPKFGFIAEVRRFPGEISQLNGLFGGPPSLKRKMPGPFLYFPNPQSFEAGVQEHFSVQYRGIITAPDAGRYTFWTASDDGSQLFVDDQMVVNNDGLHGTQWRDGGIQLTAGNHEVKVLFFQNGGGGFLRVDWSGPNFARGVMPVMLRADGGCDTLCHTLEQHGADALQVMQAGALAQMWELGSDASDLNMPWVEANRQWTSGKDTISFSKAEDFNLPGGRVDNFAIRYTGRLEVGLAGSYKLFLVSDGGSKLIVDDTLIINNDGVHAPSRELSSELQLTRGVHTFQLSYFHNTGPAVLKFEWTGPGINTRTPVHIFQPPRDIVKRMTGGTSPENKHAEFGSVARFWTFSGRELSGLNGLFANPPNLVRVVHDPFLYFANPAAFKAGANELFAAEYTGIISAPAAGTYTFYIASDDGSQLFINNKLVVDNDGLHSTQWKEANVQLTQGPQRIKVLFFQNRGGGYLRVDWKSATFSRSVVPIMIEPSVDCNDRCEEWVEKLRTVIRKGVARPPAGAVVQLYLLGGDTPNLNLPWGSPNKRWVYTGTTIDFNSPQAFALPDNRLELFATRYYGSFVVPKDGKYTFIISSDDGSKLYINDDLVVDNDGLHGAQERSGEVELNQGLNSFRLDFFQNYGGGSLRMWWTGPGINGRALVPVLQPVDFEKDKLMGGVLAKYGYKTELRRFSNPIGQLNGLFTGRPANTANVKTPFIDYPNAASFGANAERFSIQYTGFINAPTTGLYHFWTVSDDGSQLFVDNQLVVNNDGAHGAQWRDGSIQLARGLHKVKILFFQAGGGGMLRVDWQGPTFSRGIMPVIRKPAKDKVPPPRPVDPNAPVPGAVAELWYLGGDTPNLNLPWTAPNKRWLFTDREIALNDPAAFRLPDNRRELFALRYTGRIDVKEAATYVFYTSSDDGSKLYVDGQLIVDNMVCMGLRSDRDRSSSPRVGTLSSSISSKTLVVGL